MNRLFFIAFAFALILCACGVEKEGSDSSITSLGGSGGSAGKTPDLSGQWTIVFLTLETTCVSTIGFAIHNPIYIPKVVQDGNNLQAYFDLDRRDAALNGVIYAGYVTVTLQELGLFNQVLFIETLAGEAESPIFYGSFNGQELGSGDCMESGLFAINVER